MTHPTDAQIDAAIKNLTKIIEAAENSNHAGEMALMMADAAPSLCHALRMVRIGAAHALEIIDAALAKTGRVE